MSFFRLIARRVRAKMMEGYRVGKLSLFMRIVRLLLKRSAAGVLGDRQLRLWEGSYRSS